MERRFKLTFSSPEERDQYIEQRKIEMTQLLHAVVQQLNGDFDSTQSLTLVLQQISSFFQYGCAFIYECDHTRQLFLKEHWTVTPNIHLPEVFRPDEYLSPEQIVSLFKAPLLYNGQEPLEDDLISWLREILGMNNLFSIFITDDSNDIISCVGIADQRTHYTLSPDDIEMIDHLLKLVGERTRLRVYKRRLEFTSATLENIMDHTGFDIYVNDFDTHEMLYANKSMAAPYGGWENMRGKTCHAALYDGQEEECTYCPKQHLIDEEGNPTIIYAWDYQRPFDNAWFRVISTAFKWVDGRLAQVISSADITQAKNNELLIERMAYTDPLTGISNRLRLQADFEVMAAQPNILETGITIFFIDLNNFKEINDTMGHIVGDSVLKQLAKIFSEDELTKDHCYRYGGDEFIFLYAGLSAAESEERQQQLAALLSTPLNLEGQSYTCSGSIGWARCPEDGTTYESLLDNADIKMYEQKAQFHKKLRNYP